jgi:hypothetical protein
VYIFSPLLFTLQALWMPALCGLGLSLVFSILLRLTSNERRFIDILVYYSLFTLPIALIAFCAGDLTGLSRSSAIGSVIPAILALLAGLNIYVFGSENRFKILVGYCAFVLVFMLFLGIQTGAFQRESEREGYLKYLSEQEFRVRLFRKNLGLPEEMPAWISGSDSK